MFTSVELIFSNKLLIKCNSIIFNYLLWVRFKLTELLRSVLPQSCPARIYAEPRINACGANLKSKLINQPFLFSISSLIHELSIKSSESQANF